MVVGVGDEGVAVGDELPAALLGDDDPGSGWNVPFGVGLLQPEGLGAMRGQIGVVAGDPEPLVLGRPDAPGPGPPPGPTFFAFCEGPTVNRVEPLSPT